MFFAVADHWLPPWCRGPRERGVQSAGTAFLCALQPAGDKDKHLLLRDLTSAQLVLILAPNTHRTQSCPCVWAQLEASLLTVTEAPLSCFPACPAASWAPPSSAPGAACGLGASSQLEPGAQWEDVGTPHFCLELLCSILSPGGTLQANSNGVKEGFPLPRQLLDHTLREQRCSRESAGSKLQPCPWFHSSTLPWLEAGQ